MIIRNLIPIIGMYFIIGCIISISIHSYCKSNIKNLEEHIKKKVPKERMLQINLWINCDNAFSVLNTEVGRGIILAWLFIIFLPVKLKGDKQ